MDVSIHQVCTTEKSRKERGNTGVDDKNRAAFLDQAFKNHLVCFFWKDHMPKMWEMTLVAKNTFSLVTAKLSMFLQYML